MTTELELTLTRIMYAAAFDCKLHEVSCFEDKNGEWEFEIVVGRWSVSGEWGRKWNHPTITEYSWIATEGMITFGDFFDILIYNPHHRQRTLAAYVALHDLEAGDGFTWLDFFAQWKISVTSTEILEWKMAYHDRLKAMLAENGFKQKSDIHAQEAPCPN